MSEMEKKSLDEETLQEIIRRRRHAMFGFDRITSDPNILGGHSLHPCGSPRMKFLADMGIARSTVAFLRVQGHDAVHLRDQGL